jgi:hypothetical protein
MTRNDRSHSTWPKGRNKWPWAWQGWCCMATIPSSHDTLLSIPLWIQIFSRSWTRRNPYIPFRSLIQYQLPAKFADQGTPETISNLCWVCVTDHKAQGQTLEWVIVDIGTTKKFPVTPFTAYVALLCSRGRETVILLHDFDDTIFTQHPSHHLHLEDERLNANTRDK